MVTLTGDEAWTADASYDLEESRGRQPLRNHPRSLRNIGPGGRRALVTGIGAILSLSCGAGVATAFRLPLDMNQADQPEVMTVQDELPATTAIRAFALANPPPDPALIQKAIDDVSPPDPTPDVAMTADDAQSDKNALPDQDQEPADRSATASAPQPAPGSTQSPAA